MYKYRQLSKNEKQNVLNERRNRKFPLYAPPHFPDGKKSYIITAAIYEHKNIIQPEDRRIEFTEKLIHKLNIHPSFDLFAWVVLPNHYHLLVSLDLNQYSNFIRVFHSKMATKWNKEDNEKGRKIWYRFSDRAIRNEKHFFASLNYIHNNPVRHEYVEKANHWHCSSIHDYLKNEGRKYLVRVWQGYPIDEMGIGWDDF